MHEIGSWLHQERMGILFGLFTEGSSSCMYIMQLSNMIEIDTLFLIYYNIYIFLDPLIRHIQASKNYRQLCAVAPIETTIVQILVSPESSLLRDVPFSAKQAANDFNGVTIRWHSSVFSVRISFVYCSCASLYFIRQLYTFFFCSELLSRSQL